MDATTDLLECSICTEPFEDARFLKCVHTFCVDCLQKMVTSKTRYITCPTCRSKTNLSVSGVSDLPHNFYVDKMREALQGKQADSCKKHEQALLDVTTLLKSCQDENERLNVTIHDKDKEMASNLLRKELKKGRRRIETLETHMLEKDKYVEALLNEKEKHTNETVMLKRELNEKNIDVQAQVSHSGQVKKQLEELRQVVTSHKGNNNYFQTLLYEKRNETEKIKTELRKNKMELKAQISLCGQVTKQLEELQTEVADSEKQQYIQILKQELHVKSKECRNHNQKTEECRNLYLNIIQKIEKCSKLINNMSVNFGDCKEFQAIVTRFYECSRCHTSHFDTSLIRIELNKLSRELNCIMEETNHIKEQFKHIKTQFSYISRIKEESNIQQISIFVLVLLFSIFGICIVKFAVCS